MTAPSPTARSLARLRARFDRYIRPGANGCAEWTGGKDADGYGIFGIPNGLIPQTWQSHRAHRVAWMFAHGEIPEGQHVLHLCDNPSCVNPGHLRLGTNAENMADRNQKNRQARGERNGFARFTEAEVAAIKSELRQGDRPRLIAARHGCSLSAIQHIRYGRHWAWVA